MFIDEVEYKVVRESDSASINVVGFKTAKVEAYMMAVDSARLFDTIRVYGENGDTIDHTVIRDGYDIITD